MPDKPVLIRNLRPGPTVFDAGQRIDWAGLNDPEGEDIQPVPYDIATGDVNFLRAMGKGVFGVDSQNDEDVKNTIATAVQRFSRAKPGQTDDEPPSKYGKLEIIEMQEETQVQGKIGQDKEVRVPVTVEANTRG